MIQTRFDHKNDFLGKLDKEKAETMSSLLRCSICKSSDLKEEYEGAEITCTGCGYIGCIEQIPSVYSLFTLKESLESVEDRKHREMEAFAAEMERNVDISDTLSQLSVRQRRERRHNHE